ncbi:hypothetical protein CRE_29742 [Caenorhabditis remanei]|nr:hypothetical protein CRE_29742 [Caenorhabditis remanei]
MARENIVMNSRGQKIEVEFGRLREYYLYTFAPNKEFVSVRDHVAHDKALDNLREKQRINIAQRKDKQATKIQLLKEYEQSKSVMEDPMTPRIAGTTQRERKEDTVVEAKATTPVPLHVEKFVLNTTDDKRKTFHESWFRQPMSRCQRKKTDDIFWISGNEDDQSVDDDPEGKYTVTAETMIETLTAGGNVKDSGVVEPTSSKTIMTDPLKTVYTRYKNSCGKEIVFLNTLKGTIDFIKKQPPEKTNKSNTISVEEPTDVLNQITFGPTIITHVFKGRRLKRQNKGRKGVETFEENRKEYTRESGEETSGV